MRKLLALSICAVALFGLMSCQNETTSIVDQLKYSDTPNWSGTTWQGKEAADSNQDGIEETTWTETETTTVSSSTWISLKEKVYELELNANGDFQFTISCVYGTNWANDYIPDNWKYSTDPNTFSPPDLIDGGIDYSQAFINGEFYSTDAYGSVPAEEYTIVQSPTATYGNAAVYRVNINQDTQRALKATALVGKAYEVDYTEGTYVIRARSASPVDKSSTPWLNPESSRSNFNRTFDDAGAFTGEEDVENRTIEDFWEIYDFNSGFDFTNGLAVNPEGKQVYSILCNSFSSMEKALIAKRIYEPDWAILYQQN